MVQKAICCWRPPYHISLRLQVWSWLPIGFEMENLTLKIEQETQKRCLIQNDLKMQIQHVNALKAVEKQLKRENDHLIEIKQSLEKQNNELRKERQDAGGQMKEIQDQLETEQFFQNTLRSQPEVTVTQTGSEQLARSIAEEQYSDLEKEKIVKELEIKEMMARHKQELTEKDATIASSCHLPALFYLCQCCH